jgi:RimJ/RimL family protein N-acetyltransferase
MKVSPVTLEGKRAKLIPLEESHIEELYEAGMDNGIWTYYTFRKIGSLDEFRNFIFSPVAPAENSDYLGFTIINKETGKIAGSTCFLDISHKNSSMEIGRTWLSPVLWGTGFNEECKYLLLKHCFEDLKAVRVFFKTDETNIRSRKALEKIGAKFEGVWRKHMIREDGTFRTSAYYSIIDDEWGTVKKHLESILNL